MSGVQTRSRLEQLEALRRRTVHEIAQAHRRGERTELTRLYTLRARIDNEIEAAGGPPAPTPPRQRADHVGDHLARLGVTSHDVKVWAVAQGLVPAVVRGRISAALVDAYAAQHAEAGVR